MKIVVLFSSIFKMTEKEMLKLAIDAVKKEKENQKQKTKMERQTNGITHEKITFSI